jgi:hypothetical protein
MKLNFLTLLILSIFLYLKKVKALLDEDSEPKIIEVVD